MTREEAIYELKRDIHNAKVSHHLSEHYEMAIKALEQEPSIDELRVEITALQKRCYALTKGVMCGFCNYECQYAEKDKENES